MRSLRQLAKGDLVLLHPLAGDLHLALELLTVVLHPLDTKIVAIFHDHEVIACCEAPLLEDFLWNDDSLGVSDFSDDDVEIAIIQ